LIYAAFHLADADRMIGWLFARLILEITICSGLLVTELGKSESIAADLADDQGNAENAPMHLGTLALLALPIGASLIARSLIDNGPVLWLAAMKVDSELVARFGIFITIVAVALVPAGVIQGVAVPRLAGSVRSGSGGSSYAALFAGLGLLTAIGFSVLILLSTIVVPWSHLDQRDILLPGILLAIAKMSASAMGGYLLVTNRGNVIFSLNGTTLVMAASASMAVLLMQLPISLSLIVSALAAIETAAACLYGIAATITSRSGVTTRLV
jgi:hypothetical protein